MHSKLCYMWYTNIEQQVENYHIMKNKNIIIYFCRLGLGWIFFFIAVFLCILGHEKPTHTHTYAHNNKYVKTIEMNTSQSFCSLHMT